MKLWSRVTILLALALVFAFPGAAIAQAQATDILLLLDTTGSMSEALEPAVDDIQEISDRVRGELGDVDFGVAQVRDYPIALFGDSDSGDLPYQVVQPLTSDRDAVLRGLNGLFADGGGDGPEAYGRALRDADVGAGLNWRPSARRLVILVADNVPHDDDLNWGIPSPTFPTPFNTIRDPGTDAVTGTGDDIDWQGLMTQLNEHGLPLMFVLFEGEEKLLPYWQTWAGWTGGAAASAESTNLSGIVVDLAKRGATAKLPQCPPGQSRDEARRCRPYWDWLGYSFENGNLPSWARAAKLDSDQVLTDGLLQRTFTDMKYPAYPRDYLWPGMAGGVCYGMALSGGRFSTALQPFRSAGDGRSAAAWEATATPRLNGPTWAGDAVYRRELLQTLATDFVSQYSTEVRASIFDQERYFANPARSGQAGAAMRGQLEAIMSSGHGSVGASKLASERPVGVAMVVLANPNGPGGHAVVAYNVRDTAGGGFQIDIWDNNQPGKVNWIPVSADGSWSYAPLDYTAGKPSELSFLPEYPARGLHYQAGGPLANGGEVSIVDLPAGVDNAHATAQESDGDKTSVHVQPILLGGSEDAGSEVVSDGSALHLSLVDSNAEATARGHGVVLTAAGLTGVKPASASFDYDLDHGTVAAQGPRAGVLSVTRGDLYAGSNGASGLGLARSGATTVEASRGGSISLVLVANANGSLDSTTLSLKLPRWGVATIAANQVKKALQRGGQVVVRVRGRGERAVVRTPTESIAHRYGLEARVRVRHHRATVTLSSLRHIPANSEARVLWRISQGKRVLRRRAVELTRPRTGHALAPIALPKGVRRATVKAVVHIAVSKPGPAELVAAASDRVLPQRSHHNRQHH